MLALEMSIFANMQVQYSAIDPKDLPQYFPRKGVKLLGLEKLEQEKATAVYCEYDAQGNPERIRIILESGRVLHLVYNKWERRMVCNELSENSLDAFTWLDHLIPESMVVEYMSTIKPAILYDMAPLEKDLNRLRINGMKYAVTDLSKIAPMRDITAEVENLEFDIAVPTIRFSSSLEKLDTANSLVLYASRNLADYYTSNKVILNDSLKSGRFCNILELNSDFAKVRALGD